MPRQDHTDQFRVYSNCYECAQPIVRYIPGGKMVKPRRRIVRCCECTADYFARAAAITRPMSFFPQSQRRVQ